MDPVEQVLAEVMEQMPGAILAGLLGTDGVGVQVALGEDWQETDAQAVEVELAALGAAVQKAAAGLEANPSPDFFLGTAQANFLGVMVSPAYFLVLGLPPDGDLDRARAVLNQARAALAGA